MPAIAFRSARRSRNRRAVTPCSTSCTARAPARAAASPFSSCSSAGTSPSPTQRDSQAVDRDGHRVGGEVPCTRAHARAGDALELVEVLARHQPAFLRPDRLPHVLDRHARVRASGRRASDRCRRAPRACPRVRAPSARQAPSCRNRRHTRAPSKSCAMNHQLDRVGDHLARDQRCPHAGSSLRLVVGDRDRVEAERKAARGGDTLADAVGELALVEVAGHRSRPRRRDADDRSAEPSRVDAHRPEVRACRRTFGALEQLGAGPSAEGVDRRFSHPSTVLHLQGC